MSGIAGVTGGQSATQRTEEPSQETVVNKLADLQVLSDSDSSIASTSTENSESSDDAAQNVSLACQSGFFSVARDVSPSSQPVHRVNSSVQVSSPTVPHVSVQKQNDDDTKLEQFFAMLTVSIAHLGDQERENLSKRYLLIYRELKEDLVLAQHFISLDDLQRERFVDNRQMILRDSFCLFFFEALIPKKSLLSVDSSRYLLVDLARRLKKDFFDYLEKNSLIKELFAKADPVLQEKVLSQFLSDMLMTEQSSSDQPASETLHCVLLPNGLPSPR